MIPRTVVRIVLPAALVPTIGADAQSPSVTLRVNTQLVEVTVVAKDAHGAPVTSLKQSDFEIYDKGKKQEIRLFQVENHQPAGAPTAPPAVGKPLPAVDPVFTNRTPAEADAPNAPTVLLIDAGNTWDTSRMTWPDLVYARDQVIQFLRQVRPEDRLGVYLMGANRFWILHEYNQTCADLVARLATWKATSGPDSHSERAPDVWTEFAIHFAHVDAETAKAIHRAQFYGTGPAGSSALPDEGSQISIRPHPGIDSTGFQESGPPTEASLNQQGAYVFSAEDHPVQMLAGVANHLVSVPGRKNIILISGQFFLPIDYREQLKVLRAIIRTGVSVYTIDPGGLAPFVLDASFAIPSGVTAFASPRANGQQIVSQYMDRTSAANKFIIDYLQNSLRTVSEMTGGQVFINTNGIRDAIRSAFEDSRVTYTLGFYPHTSHDDGSYHAIKVKLAGHENVSLRYREGYMEPSPPSRDPQQREAEMRQAVWSPVDASGIELHATVLPVGGARYEVKLRIGVDGIDLEPNGDRRSGQIEVALVQRDNLGHEYEPILRTLGLMLSPETYDKALKTGLQFSQDFPLNPAATTIRVVVRDVNSSGLGTLTIPSPAIR